MQEALMQASEPEDPESLWATDYEVAAEILDLLVRMPEIQAVQDLIDRMMRQDMVPAPHVTAKPRYIYANGASSQ
jgi:hypothetical protein